MATVDLLRSVCDELVSHLQTQIDAHSEIGAGDIPVRRGWNHAARTEGRIAYVTVSGIGNPTITPYSRALVDQTDDAEAGTTEVVWAVGEWQVELEVRLWTNTEDGSRADEILGRVLPVLQSALRSRYSFGDTTLRLTVSGYHSRPCAYRMVGQVNPDSAMDGVEGTYSGGYIVRATSQECEVETLPIAETIAAVFAWPSGPIDDTPDTPTESTIPARANDYWTPLIADALTTFGSDGTTDVYSQDAATGEITVTLDPGTFGRTEPDDSQELRTWIWALVDARGIAADFKDESLQVEVGVLINQSDLPPASDGYVVWCGLADRVGNQNGAGGQRIAGIEIDDDPRLRLQCGGLGATNLGDRAHAVRLVCQSWTNAATAILTDPTTGEPRTGADAVSLTRSKVIPDDNYLYLGIGTKVSGATELSAIKVTPYVRVTRLDSPS